MITSSRQLKDLIRNLSRTNAANPQILLRSYMTERFLERISVSEFKDMFILKGGMLVTSLVGVGMRSTMDIDTTLKNTNVTIDEVNRILHKIMQMPFEDGVVFKLKELSIIMEDASYPGIRASIESEFDDMRIPLKLDISTGDVITPKEIQYSYPLMLENRYINIWTYNLETILAEKVETILSRSVANTRMRDFYDIYILLETRREQINPLTFKEALHATAQRRNTLFLLPKGPSIFKDIEQSPEMQSLWKSYQIKFPYASEIAWENVMSSISRLYDKIL